MIERDRVVYWLNGHLKSALCGIYWVMGTLVVLSVLDVVTSGIVVVIRRWTHGAN